MRELRYVISDSLGIHARPAGLLVKKLTDFPGDVRVGVPQNMVDGKRLFSVMGLGLKKGDELCLTFDGDGEDRAVEEAELFLRANL